jgi:hypothetical protein
MKAPVLFVALTLGFASLAFGWGKEGHTAIAQLAETMLSAKASNAVHKLIGTNNLASVALWADQTRQLMDYHTGALVGNLEASNFNIAHPNNDKWHFCNLPLDTFKYLDDGTFATNTDIVHTLTNCIAVLEGRSQFVTTTQALRYVVHLVGDLHQPLHVGCGFYATNQSGGGFKLLTDPGLISSARAHDRGGNMLQTNSLATTNDWNLHSFWDDDLVAHVDPSPGNHQLQAILTAALKPAQWKSSGTYREWPARWAVDSVKVSRTAYAGIRFLDGKFTSKGLPQKIQIALPLNYDANETPVVRDQLAKGGFHLAELLNKIKWK